MPELETEDSLSPAPDFLWLLSTQRKLVDEVQQQHHTMNRIEEWLGLITSDEGHLSHTTQVLIDSMDLLFNVLTANKNISEELLSHIPQTEGWIKVRKPAWRTHLEKALQAQTDGFETARKKLISFLADLGLELIAPRSGDPFNPYYHRALEEVSSGKQGCVYALIRYGYTHRGDLLRCADVTVSKTSSPEGIN